jgi:proline dehydrogenase
MLIMVCGIHAEKLGKFDKVDPSLKSPQKKAESPPPKKKQRAFRKKLIQFHMAIDTMTCSQLDEVSGILDSIGKKEKSSNIRMYYKKAEGVVGEVYINKGCDDGEIKEEDIEQKTNKKQ